MVQAASQAPTGSPNFSPDYDVVVVGTSPMCMLAAIAERADGKRVVMVDAAEEVGGTWKVTELLGYSNVELGCHELDAIHPVYDLMEDLGIPLPVMDPQPMFTSVEPSYFPKRILYHQRWVRELHDVVTGRTNLDLFWVKQGGPKARVRALLRVGRLAMRSLRGENRPSKYPKNGAMDIVRPLDVLAREAGVEVRSSTWLSDVEIDREARVVRFKLNGVETTASAMHLTSSSNLGAIKDGDERVELEATQNRWQTLYLSLLDCPKPPFTYTVFTNPTLLQRASDLSRYAIPSQERPNARLIALTIDDSAPETEATALECLRRMKAMGLLNAEAHLESFAYLPYAFTRIDEWKRREIEQRLQPLVMLHETSLLTPSINNLMKKRNFRELLGQVRTDALKRSRAGAGA